MKRKIVAITMLFGLILALSGGVISVVTRPKKIPIYSVETEKKQVAISFDAAWGSDKTLRILKLCDDYNVKATFFLVGFWIDANPDLVKEISLRGHEIGTHSETHPQMTKLSTYDKRKELTSSIAKITSITGEQVCLFRAPFGDYNDDLLLVCESLNLFAIQWSKDSLDWKGLSGVEIANRLSTMEQGDIILCHNNSEHILTALPLIFQCAQSKGLEFVKISDLIYHKNYVIDNTGRQKQTLS